MHVIKRLPAAIFAAAFAASAAPAPELLDLASRVHYGYYNAEPRAIDAAAAALQRLADSPQVLYYRDFATLRRAQLSATNRAVLEQLEACAEREVAEGLDKRFAGEAWALVAACAEVAGDDAHRERALSEARAHDSDNPRIALVEAWALERTAGTDAAGQAVAAAKLEAAAEAFATRASSIDDPDWGHAEALTALAARAFGRGQARAARDLLERALLLAPDYRAALQLRSALQSARPGGGAL